MAFNVGDQVKIKAPMNITFSGVYVVMALAASPDTYTVDVWNDGTGSDFYIDYLEAA